MKRVFAEEKRIDILARLAEELPLLMDAAMGTALMEAGQPVGMNSAEMNISAPEAVRQVHLASLRAGCDVVTSNTFGVTALYLGGKRALALQAAEAGAQLALQAAEEAAGAGGIGARGLRRAAVALDIGPAGCLLGELGAVSYEAAEDAFRAQAEAGARGGADFLLLETFADLEEFVRAAGAAKAASGLPVLGTMAFGASGRTFMGAAPADFVRAARRAEVAAVGANCGLPPAEMLPILAEILAEAETCADPLPVIAQPNAGLPGYENGQTVYRMEPETFAEATAAFLTQGVRVIGGCCGTTPEMIACLRRRIDAQKIAALHE